VDEVDRAWELRRALGRELKAWRKAAGLIQLQLASRTGYSRSTVATLESVTGGALTRHPVIGYTTARKPAAPAAPEAPAR
jgi:hypothetical protein